MGRSIFVFGFVVLALIIAISSVNGNECPNTIVKLLPCKGFLMGKGDISVPCCNGVKGLMKILATNDNDLKLKNVCECLKKEALSIGVVQERAEQIPHLCNINISLPIGPNVDCKTLKASSASTQGFKLNKYRNTGIMSFKRPIPNHDNHSIHHKKPLVIVP
nr:non-specific lipid-transfer protein 1-like [Nicotiana tomentosiformis]